MNDPFVSIIIRSFNEGWALRETLPALGMQNFTHWELIVIDSGSTDGSVELIRQAKPRQFVQIKPEEYNPSRVMNLGMELARSEFVVFLNADATPQGGNWLRPLVRALQDPATAAVFGRQAPRPDCRAVYAHDYARCFGPKRESARWEHFFSMVSSGIRKDIWAKRGFLPSLQYSEDDEYTRWCVAQGFRVVYCPESVVMHSHNYTPAQAYKRSYGEAAALAAVWTRSSRQVNWLRTVLLGWGNDVRRDMLYCARTRQPGEWPHAARIRWEQRRAKLAGFRAGWERYRNGSGISVPGAPPSKAAYDSRVQQGWMTAEPSACPHDVSRLGRRRSGLVAARFTIDGSDALEQRLASTCERVLEGVLRIVPEQKLEGLVLGGGYGRGQGGVLRTEAGDRAYNDLEFYCFLKGNRLWNEREYRQPLQKLGEQLSPEAGLHVEFKVDSLARLRRAPVSMFSYDLVSGHQMIYGDAGMFQGCERHLDARAIPVEEATRLLLNRCTGLLLAKELLQEPSVDEQQADFIGRNLAKAQLALGDALLAAAGQYHWNCLERERRLRELSRSGSSDWLQQIRQHHSAGVQFKLRPQRSLKALAEVEAEHCEISTLASRVWLHIESRRLGKSFSSPAEYSLNRLPKCLGASRWRNLLLNLRTFGPKAAVDGLAWRYPRERLFHALPLLLWSASFDAQALRFLQRQLVTHASDWTGMVSAYKRVWEQYG